MTRGVLIPGRKMSNALGNVLLLVGPWLLYEHARPLDSHRRPGSAALTLPYHWRQHQMFRAGGGVADLGMIIWNRRLRPQSGHESEAC